MRIRPIRQAGWEGYPPKLLCKNRKKFTKGNSLALVAIGKGKKWKERSP